MNQNDHTNHQEIIQGLIQENAYLSPIYFYDELGSKLFEAITLLDEYYPTRTEQSIFQNKIDEIVAIINGCEILIDLGAGNCQKASQLFPKLRPLEYLALDISKEFLEEAIKDLQELFPAIQMHAQVVDLNQRIYFPKYAQRKKVFFYPGSSIGNFSPSNALALIQNIKDECAGKGGLLIGVDLVKDNETLQRAYDDTLGVTAAFNLNALLHVNELVGSDFQIGKWQHRAIYNARDSRIEMHLESLQEQTVQLLGHSRIFKKGERIHTENSYKYTLNTFTNLLKKAGFGSISCWTDPLDYFLVCYASAEN